MVHVKFVSIWISFHTEFYFLASEDCLTLTSLHAVSRSVLHDGQDATCFTIPEVKGVTPLQKIELTQECRNRVENNQVLLLSD